MKRTARLLSVGLSLVLAASCGGRRDVEAKAERVGQAFGRALCAGDFTAASMFIHDDDSLAFHEQWKDLQSRVKQGQNWTFSVQNDQPGQSATLTCKGQPTTAAPSGGEAAEAAAPVASLSFALVCESGDWCVRVPRVGGAAADAE